MGRSGNTQNKTQFDKPGAANRSAVSAVTKIIETAEVIDVVMDPSHPNYSPASGIVIGAIKARPLSRFNNPIENLSWYHPYFSNFYTQYPLIGENVVLITAAGKGNSINPNLDEKYYLPPINVFQDANHNQNPGISISKPLDPSEAEDCNPSGQYTSNPGTEKEEDPEAVELGKTFEAKELIKIFPYEGDTVLEGRFGQSMRLGSTSKFADTPNYWSSEGKNGDAITIISNGHSVPEDSEFHLEDINRDSAVIMYCEGQLIPILVASELWDSYGVTFERKEAEQKALDFVNDKEMEKHPEIDINMEETGGENKDDACEDGYVMDEDGECVEEQNVEKEEEFEANTDVRGTVKNCWDADEANGNDERKSLLKEMVDDLVSNGATPEGACAIIGNALAEGAGPVCNSPASKDPGEAVKSSLRNLEKWRTGNKIKSNQNAYWNGTKTTERGGKVCDQGCWCGVGAFEVDTVYPLDGKKYGPGQSSQYSRYSNWQGGIGIIQWTGTRRTKFEIALGIPAYNDGTGGIMWPKTSMGKNGGGKWKNDSLIKAPTDINFTPAPHNRTAYNRAIETATYKGSKPGLNAQLVYAMEEMRTRNNSVYVLVTTSRDIGKITHEVYAKYETPTSYVYGGPNGKRKKSISDHPNRGDTYEDYYNYSVKKRTENAEDTLITWKGFLFAPPIQPIEPSSTLTPTVQPIPVVIGRADGHTEIEVYKGLIIAQEDTAEDDYSEINDNPASYFFKVENSFLPHSGLDGIEDKAGFLENMTRNGGPMKYQLQTNIRSAQSIPHIEANKTFPRSAPFGADGYLFAIKKAIDEEIETWIEDENF